MKNREVGIWMYHNGGGKDIEKKIKDNTKLIVMSHVSNVTGNIFDIKAIGIIAKNNGIIFFLDAAQSAGVLDIDVKQYNIDMLSFTGHKYLFSLQGTCGLYIREGLDINPLLIGRNTYNSKEILPKLDMPEVIEAGTQNIAGIVTLKKSVEYIIKNNQKTKTIYFEIETFSANLKWASALCDALKTYNENRNTKIVFGVNYSLRKNMDENISMLYKMKEANFEYIKVGLESGSYRIRKDVLKRPMYSY